MPDIVGIVKKAAIEAVEASKPVNLLFGTVASVAPPTIQVDQKTILTAAMLVLCVSVVDHWEDVTVSLADENNVKVTGRKKVKIHGGLTPGETVLLARMQGGKKFAVIDRIKPAVNLSGEWIE